MRVVVCAAPADSGDIRTILLGLRDAGIDSGALSFGPRWQELSLKALEGHLSKATHYLLVWSAASAASTWIPFLAGHASGRSHRSAVYRLPGAPPLPGYLGVMPACDSRGELTAYYETERESWLKEADRHQAKRELFDMGIPYTIDSMAACATEGDIAALSLFVRAGLSASARDRHGVPALCLAVRAKHRRTAELLLSLGADIDAQSDDRGNSALMDAAGAGAPDIVADLIRAGAAIDLSSKNGQTALAIAVGKGDAECIGLLLDAGADPDRIDKLGMSPRQYAKLFRDPAMAVLFENLAKKA